MDRVYKVFTEFSKVLNKETAFHAEDDKYFYFSDSFVAVRFPKEILQTYVFLGRKMDLSEKLKGYFETEGKFRVNISAGKGDLKDLKKVSYVNNFLDVVNMTFSGRMYSDFKVSYFGEKIFSRCFTPKEVGYDSLHINLKKLIGIIIALDTVHSKLFFGKNPNDAMTITNDNDRFRFVIMPSNP